jgi:hypothetical protein
LASAKREMRETQNSAVEYDPILRIDAEEAARRTLRYKFGRLSNRRIIARVREGAAEATAEVTDEQILEQWFLVYEDALHRLRAARTADASPATS